MNKNKKGLLQITTFEQAEEMKAQISTVLFALNSNETALSPLKFWFKYIYFWKV